MALTTNTRRAELKKMTSGHSLTFRSSIFGAAKIHVAHTPEVVGCVAVAVNLGSAPMSLAVSDVRGAASVFDPAVLEGEHAAHRLVFAKHGHAEHVSSELDGACQRNGGVRLCPL